MSGVLSGVFIKELPNRFLCEVEVNGIRQECYVPSSCHLGNFLLLNNRRVLLTKNLTGNTRTQYSLLAVPYKRSYIILNTSLANIAVKNSINRKIFEYLGNRRLLMREHYVKGYKSDIFIPDSKTIIEIKSLISLDTKAIFPSVYSDRSIRQLLDIRKLLKSGYRVVFLIISLNPYVKEIKIDTDTELCKVMKSCIKAGMIIKGYSCGLKEMKPALKKEIEVVI